MSEYKDLSPEEFKEATENNPDAIIIDCRTLHEISEFSLEYTHHIDIMSPAFGIKLSELDKDKPCYIYCRSGNRSAFLCEYMFRMGFKELYNLDGGILAWRYLIK